MEGQPNQAPAIQDFIGWFEGACSLGSGNAGPSLNCRFLPNPKLDDYLRHPRNLQKLLEAVFPNTELLVDPNVISKDYAKVFLILLLINHARYITHFVQYDSLSDLRLPFETRPSGFPRPTPEDPDFFDSFHRLQWQFCAPILHDSLNRRFEAEEVVLPIIRKDVLGAGGSATTYKIQLHPAYDRLKPESDASLVLDIV